MPEKNTESFASRYLWGSAKKNEPVTPVQDQAAVPAQPEPAPAEAVANKEKAPKKPFSLRNFMHENISQKIDTEEEYQRKRAVLAAVKTEAPAAETPVAAPVETPAEVKQEDKRTLWQAFCDSFRSGKAKGEEEANQGGAAL